MSNRIKTGDLVKVIAGKNKGQSGKITKISGNRVFVEGLNNRVRHLRPNQYRTGGKKEIQTGIDASNVALIVNAKAGTTSRVGFAKNDEGKTIRLARQANNREIK